MTVLLNKRLIYAVILGEIYKPFFHGLHHKFDFWFSNVSGGI